MSRLLVLLALPIATGTASVLWSMIAAASRPLTAALSAASYAALCLLLLAVDGPATRADVGVGVMLAFAALSVLVPALWLLALPSAPVAVIAVVESSYPLAALAVSWALIGPPTLSPIGVVGAALVLAGVPMIAIGTR